MGTHPAQQRGDRLPVETVSRNAITLPEVFLDRLDRLPEARALAATTAGARATIFRLPSEDEWEYAARGACFHNDAVHCTPTWRNRDWAPPCGSPHWLSRGAGHSRRLTTT